MRSSLLQSPRLSKYSNRMSAFYPYSSKYDAYLAGQATLSPQEARGLALFNDPAKGNCNSCHRSERGGNDTPPQFTDYGLIAHRGTAQSRNPRQRRSNIFRPWACGPLRTDLAGRGEYCGLFKTPTLRNVVLRQAFFHNGLVHSLREAVVFYVERDTRPGKWYSRDATGNTRNLTICRWNIRVTSITNHRSAAAARQLSCPDISEIDDIVAFLNALNDGYTSDWR